MATRKKAENVETVETVENTETVQHEISDEIRENVMQMADNGDTRARIAGYLMFQHNYSTKDANEIVRQLLGKSGINGVTLEKVTRYIRENYEKVEKPVLLEEMSKITGAKVSSLQHMYNHIRFAMEYARQEMESTETAETE